MLHYIRFYNHHIFIFFTLILHKLFCLPIYILMYTSTSAVYFNLAYEGFPNIAVVPQKIQRHGYVTVITVTLFWSWQKMEIWPSRMLPWRSSLMLELQQFSARGITEFSYPFKTQSSAIKNVPPAERLCSELTSLRIAFSIQSIPSSVSGNYLDQPQGGLYPHCQLMEKLNFAFTTHIFTGTLQVPWDNHVWFILPKCLKHHSTPKVWGFYAMMSSMFEM